MSGAKFVLLALPWPRALIGVVAMLVLPDTRQKESLFEAPELLVGYKQLDLVRTGDERQWVKRSPWRA